MQITVLSVAFPFAPVRDNTPGGAEQILFSIDSALTRCGHRSIVIACEGSEIAGDLVAIPSVQGTIDQDKKIEVQRTCKKVIEQIVRARRVDLVHMHGLDFDTYIPNLPIPVLITFHLPVHWYAENTSWKYRSLTYVNCVSNHQHKTFPPFTGLLDPIPNGVPQIFAPPRKQRGNFAVVLGRICPEKGIEIALDAARSAGINLVIGGMVFNYELHLDYYKKEVAPRLDGKKYRFLGPIGSKEKYRLLRAARCLLLPTSAPETSSLVAMEALACGTPVIAFPQGAIPEIIDNEKTGFLVQNGVEMANAIGKVSAIDPEECCRAARERFSADTMLSKYFNVYETIIGQKISYEAVGQHTK